LCIYFFCQAEDGIRDFHVTGVQTCALPIYEHGQVIRPPFIDPDDAMAHIDLADIAFDEDGRPTNIEQLLSDLAKRKPYLLQPQDRPRPQGVPPTPSADRQPPVNPARDYITQTYRRVKRKIGRAHV